MIAFCYSSAMSAKQFWVVFIIIIINSLSPCTPFYAYSNHRDVCLAWCHSGYAGILGATGEWDAALVFAPSSLFFGFILSLMWSAIICGISETGSSFHYRKSLISVFEGFFASIGRIFSMAGGLGTRLSFYGV